MSGTVHIFVGSVPGVVAINGGALVFRLSFAPRFSPFSLRAETYFALLICASAMHFCWWLRPFSASISTIPPPSLVDASDTPPRMAVGVQVTSGERDRHDLRAHHVLLRGVLPRHHRRHRGAPK